MPHLIIISHPHLILYNEYHMSKLDVNTQCNGIIQCVAVVECLSVSNAGDFQEEYTATGNHHDDAIIHHDDAI